MHRLFLVFAVTLAAVAGCGGSDESEGTTPAQAVTEISEIRAMLDEAVADYRSGRPAAAEQAVGDAYLEHFEDVEDPLGERDHDLMEELEEALSTELRQDIKAGKPAAEIEAAAQTSTATSTAPWRRCRSEAGCFSSGVARRRRALAGPAAAADDRSPCHAARRSPARHELVDQAVAAARGGRPRARLRPRAHAPTSTTSSSPRSRCACATRTSCSTWSSTSPSCATASATARRSATLRGDVRDSAPACVDVDRALADKGVAAPLLAFGFSFTILFREGVEAVLLIAILLGSLAAGRASELPRPLALGVVAALVATGVTWLLATLVIDIAPVNRELLEAITALRRRRRADRGQLLARRAARAPATHGVHARARGGRDRRRHAVAFAGLGFTAVYREGFETVLFYQALALFAQGLELWVVARRRHRRGRARRRRLRDPQARQAAAAQADADHRRVDPAAAVGRVRRQRRALAAGGRHDRRRRRSRRPRAAAGLRRRADRHPPDAQGLVAQAMLLAIYVARRRLGLRVAPRAGRRRRR